MTNKEPVFDNLPPPFELDSNNPEMPRGFEAGQIWHLVRSYPDREFFFKIGPENIEMITRIAEACSRVLRCQELEDGTLVMYFEPVKKP